MFPCPQKRIIPLRHGQHIIGDQLIDHQAHILFPFALQAAKARKLVKPPLPNALILFSAEHAGQKSAPIAASQRHHKRHDLPGLARHIALLLPRQAGGAMAAAGLIRLFPKVCEQACAQASASRRVKGHLLKPLPRALGHHPLRLRVHLAFILGVIDQKSVQPHIARLIKQAAHRILPIASGPACFLIIAFQIFGHVVMHDEGYV